jgi:hypothetical protein
MTPILVRTTAFRNYVILRLTVKEMNLHMRVPLTLLCLALSMPAIADEKKAGPQLSERGITSYIVERAAAPKQLALQLRAREVAIARVTIDVISEDDQIVKYEPVTGETFVVESLMSKLELTFRTEHESITARFDGKAVEWKRTGSEALFARVTANADVVGALLAELAERGILHSPELLASGSH